MEKNLKTVNLLVNIAFLVESEQSTEGLIVDIPKITVIDFSSIPKVIRVKSLEYETIDVNVTD